MSEYISLLASLFLVDLLAAMTPGPNFFLVSHLAARRGRKESFAATLGFASANIIWCISVVSGLTILFAYVPWLYVIMKGCGGVYLVYLGLRMWIKSYQIRDIQTDSTSGLHLKPYSRGFITAILNPKSVVYFGSIFTIFIKPDSPVWLRILPIGIVCFNTFLWYGIVAVIFSSKIVHRAGIGMKVWIDRIAGTVISFFGIELLLSRD